MMDNQESTPAAPVLLNHAIRQGIILGIVSIVLTVVAYAVDISFMASLKFMFLALLVSLGYVIYAGISYRGNTGGLISYGKAFQHGFITLAVSGLVGTVFNLLLYHVIDPELPQKITEAILGNTEETMAAFGTPQESIDQALDGMRNDLPEQFSLSGLGMGYFKGLIYFAIVAAITSLFVRKNPPVEI